VALVHFEGDVPQRPELFSGLAWCATTDSWPSQTIAYGVLQGMAKAVIAGTSVRDHVLFAEILDRNDGGGHFTRALGRATRRVTCLGSLMALDEIGKAALGAAEVPHARDDYQDCHGQRYDQSWRL